jgi:hypothetical protein
LQTSAYARAIHERTITPLSPGLIEQRLEVRANRQRILTRSRPPELHAIIDEAVLHREIGGPAVMADQIDWVVRTCVELPHVSVQVLPFGIGAHPALDSTFIVLKMAAPVRSVVYVEGLVGQIYLEHPQDVERYEQVFSRLRDISLAPDESLDLMQRIRAGFSSRASTESLNYRERLS